MESEFKSIATNISGWILSGRSVGLKLPPNVTNTVYKSKMLIELKSYKIEMVAHPVTFGSVEKTCVSQRVPSSAKPLPGPAIRNHIICNQQLFRDTYLANPEGIYRLVHHEFAGLAGIETNHSQDSDYQVSDQISHYLEEQKIYRLPVGAITSPPRGLRTFACGPNTVVQTHEDETGGSFGDPRAAPSSGQISPKDLVYKLFKDQSSFLAKALAAQGFYDHDGATFRVGDQIDMGGGGRVNSYTQNYVVTIVGSGKRWDEVVALVRVNQLFQELSVAKSAPAYTPNAVHMWTLQLDGILYNDNSIPAVTFTNQVYVDDMTSKNCHDIKVAKAPKSAL